MTKLSEKSLIQRMQALALWAIKNPKGFAQLLIAGIMAVMVGSVLLVVSYVVVNAVIGSAGTLSNAALNAGLGSTVGQIIQALGIIGIALVIVGIAVIVYTLIGFGGSGGRQAVFLGPMGLAITALIGLTMVFREARAKVEAKVRSWGIRNKYAFTGLIISGTMAVMVGSVLIIVAYVVTNAVVGSVGTISNVSLCNSLNSTINQIVQALGIMGIALVIVGIAVIVYTLIGLGGGGSKVTQR